LAAVAALCVGLVPLGAAAQEEEEGPEFDVFIEARVVPSERLMRVSIETDRGARHLKQAVFRIDPERHSGFSGDGTVEVDGDRVTWVPPPAGGELRYSFRIDHLRDDRGYDSRCTNTWAVFRGGDMVPAARVRFTDGARSRTRLQFVLPEGWSVAAPYTRLRGGVYRVEHAHRAFDRPTGWFVLGDLGVTIEDVAGTKVAVAGPVRHGVRRLDMLALMRWSLPELNRIIGTPVDRMLVVSAGDPMWRGGLSGPNSMFVHADRPLISNDATSPILHELVHSAMGAYADDSADWIVEGLAEYYSLQLLMRSGTLDPERVLEQLAAGEAAFDGSGRKASSRTWRGVGYFVRLDANIREATEGQQSLDGVLRVLAAIHAETDLDELRAAVAEATGLDPDEVMPDPPSRRSSRRTAAETTETESVKDAEAASADAEQAAAEAGGPPPEAAPEEIQGEVMIETETFDVPLSDEAP
jgi:hypothetical protein